jgi:hypothetical protein
MPDPDLHVTVFADDARLESLAAYSDHIDELAAVFADANAGDGALLDHHPAEGAWSVAQVLHHLADAELQQSLRLRRMLVEDNPPWGEWDEAAYADALAYDVRPAADALTLVLSVRHVNVRLLASLSAEQWRRTTEHPELGRIDVAQVVALIVEHTKGHVLQARRATLGMT